ncbi:MAG: LemA family protein [Candidatus Enteromonas sp.]|nr:LemA family protein [Candidatus Enteromonas sp.]MDY6094212.1 LemA family protein [Candidatus Enteromonas sp.]
MGNELDEMRDPVNEQGRDINVIEKQLTIDVDWRSTLFVFFLWFPLIIPGIVFAIMKIKAKATLQTLQQKIQHDASTVDNYLLNRVTILKNAASLLEKSIKLDRETFADIARFRSGNISDAERNELAGKLDVVERNINVALEAYPELRAHADIQKVMQQNEYTQREITAAREAYNDTVYQWNSLIQQWPTYRIVAAKAKYTTRIPFSVSREVKEQAQADFFA